MGNNINTFDIEGLSFTYAGAMKPSLKDINFSVGYGEFITLCGKTGSGKSTLLRNLKAVLAPGGKKEGQIKFYGRSINDISADEQARRIGFVLQDPENQIVTDKVWHELAFGLENLGVETNSIRTRVAEMATFFGISPWIGKDISELSGGQKQLLNLAAVMAMAPDILLLDEPTAALDPIASEEFINTLIRINKDIGTTVIISEHNLDQVMPASDRVMVMEKGEIIIDDIPQRIGELVSEKDSDLILTLPIPLQIYMGLKEKQIPEGNGPLTVREGRDWITRMFEGCTLSMTNTAVRIPGKTETDIKLKDIRFKYDRNGDEIIKNLDMKVDRERVTAIVGGNGAGKSTLLRIIAGILKPYKGKVYTASPKIVLLPQNPQVLFTGDSVKRELLDAGDKSGANKISEIIKLMELGELLDRHAYDLSGGEQQRVGFAKILLTDGDVFLLDEPTTGLDGASRNILGEIIKKLVSQGKTIVMVTHDLEFAARYSDTCLLLFDGQIMSQGSPKDFFSDNTYYTTAGNRMSRHIFSKAVTPVDVISLCKTNLESR